MGALGYGGIVVALLAGCVRSETDECRDGTICREGTFCVQARDDLYVCAPDDAREVCTKASLDEGAACRDNSGRCYDGACVPIACGDRLVDPGEPGVLAAEMCDDGNTLSGDGCSADCRSNENCGNGMVDPANEVCDDGNHYSNDGCNVACELETPSWRRVLIGSPPAFTAPAMAYDPMHGEAILIGDDAITYKLNSAWTAVEPALQPEPRDAASMTYDVARRQVLLFGGDSNVVPASLSDTWAWDGARWTLVDTSGPPARGRAGLTYDARRQRVVLFGGAQQRAVVSQLMDDTHEWDGSRWTEVNTPTRPSARADAAMAYDPVRGVTVLFGGISMNATRSAETWEYDGTTWRKVTPTVSPPALDGASMVAYHGKMLLFGGSTSAIGADRNDTWLYDGATWELLIDPTPQIGARRNQGMVYDSSRDRVVAFGGNTTNMAGDIDTSTFVFNGVSWKSEKFVEVLPGGASPHAAYDAAHGRAIMVAGTIANNATYTIVDDAWTIVSTGAPAGGSHDLAYDRARDVAVIVGGNTSGKVDTWRLVDVTWTKMVPAPSPSPDTRTGHVIAYDRDREQIVLYGGGDSMTENDTWVWDGIAWELRDGSSAPGGLTEPSLAYDPIRHQLIMFGGGNDDRTFAWDGMHWTEVGVSVPTVERPIPRRKASMAWNPSRQRITMFGGKNGHIAGNVLDDLWEWDGTRWTFVPMLARPDPRTGAAFVPDTNGLGLFLFGGEKADTTTGGDLWQLVWSSGLDRDRCLDLRDSDTDAKAGCADPDCWTACHPMCEPGLDCIESPRCGDGVQSSTESCRMCPEDTGGVCEICGDAYCGPNENCAADCQ